LDAAKLGLVRQVRCVGVRRVVLRLVPFRCGRYGGLDSGGVRWAKAGSGLAGKVGRVDFGFGAVR